MSGLNIKLADLQIWFSCSKTLFFVMTYWKNLQLLGALPPDLYQGLCLWTPLGLLRPPDPYIIFLLFHFSPVPFLSNRLVYLRDGSAQTIFTCCHTEIEVADQTFYLTQSQYTDTGLTSPSADLITPGAWQGSHWSANFWVTGMTWPRKNPGASGIRTRNLPPYH